MRQMLAACIAAVAITAAACSDETGPNRPLSLTLAGDSSVDSTPPGKPGPVASVTVTPSGDTVAVRDSAGFFATLRDAQGNVISDSHVKWSVADPTVARIEGEFGQSMILRALRSGSTLVTARSHGKRGSAELVVVESLPPPPPADSVASVTVMPAADTVVRGDSAIFFALLRNARGDTLSGRPVTWSVSDSTVAHVAAAFGQTVVIRTSGAGFALITATSEGKSGSAQLIVTDSSPPPPPPDSTPKSECGTWNRWTEVDPSVPRSEFRLPSSRCTIPAMSYDTLLFEIRDAIALITINRPDKLNALNDQVVDELADAAERVATEPAIRGAILTGSGTKAFVAGADIADLAKQGPFDGKARAQRGQAMLRRFETCGKPVIAAVNGYALGGGCELAMACHLRIASDTAKFGQPEVKLGIAPGYGGTQRLPRLVGKGNALHLILTGDMIDAREAHRIGLVTQVVPGAELLAAAEKTLRGILAMGPLAVRLALEAVDQGLEMTLEQGLLLEANHFGLLAATEDMKEGLTAFLEKRPPRFRGA